jgi:D-arabinose 1-dehydrogenase-like Zn-dependent alcohol dehydrogenase
MRAFTLDSFEATPGVREDLPVPELGEGDVLVRVHASSVNPVDAYTAMGALKGMMEYEFPVILGRDLAGVIERVGAGVTRYAVGDEVFGWVAKTVLHDGTYAVGDELEVEAVTDADHRALGMTWSPLGILRAPSKLLVHGRLVRQSDGDRG